MDSGYPSYAARKTPLLGKFLGAHFAIFQGITTMYYKMWWYNPQDHHLGLPMQWMNDWCWEVRMFCRVVYTSILRRCRVDLVPFRLTLWPCDLVPSNLHIYHIIAHHNIECHCCHGWCCCKRSSTRAVLIWSNEKKRTATIKAVI